MKQLTFIISVLFLFSCSTIEIGESDIFDAHKTVTSSDFDIPGYTLHDRELETEDGETLNSWFLEHDDPIATVVYFGGNGFLLVKSRPLIEAYSQMNVNLLLFDYRGYGKSSGEPTVAGIKSDAEAAFSYANSHSDENGQPLILHGHSMGSFLSAHIADRFEADGYILESPVTEVDQWTRKLIPWILRPFIRFDIAEPVKNESNLDKVRSIDIPLLIAGGTADEVTPFEMAEKLYRESASASKKLVKVEGGTHNDLPLYSYYRDSVRDFIEQISEGLN
ncbi:MAG: alpha/beta hydrolase [Balneolaceae bacterium]|nr:alpha/beta hydrolase [Balneolaceae bacterium]MCH8547574.1 alpha/beta hydrolase [Balneolaceae bacterium]